MSQHKDVQQIREHAIKMLGQLGKYFSLARGEVIPADLISEIGEILKITKSYTADKPDKVDAYSESWGEMKCRSYDS